MINHQSEASVNANNVVNFPTKEEIDTGLNVMPKKKLKDIDF